MFVVLRCGKFFRCLQATVKRRPLLFNMMLHHLQKVNDSQRRSEDGNLLSISSAYTPNVSYAFHVQRKTDHHSNTYYTDTQHGIVRCAYQLSGIGIVFVQEKGKKENARTSLVTHQRKAKDTNEVLKRWRLVIHHACLSQFHGSRSGLNQSTHFIPATSFKPVIFHYASRLHHYFLIRILHSARLRHPECSHLFLYTVDRCVWIGGSKFRNRRRKDRLQNRMENVQKQNGTEKDFNVG